MLARWRNYGNLPLKLLKRHSIVWHLKSQSFIPKYGIDLAIICALDYSRKNLHACNNICNLVVFCQLAALVDYLVLSPKSLFVHELKRQNNVPLWINAKH